MRSAADAGSWTVAAGATRRSVTTPLLVALAVAVTVGAVVASSAEGLLAWDVRFAYLPAADAVLHGHSPYPGLHDPILEDQKGYVYPPQLVLLLLPLVPLPVGVVAFGFAVAMVGLLLATLRILGIRDVRCYAAALLWVPAISGVLLSNVSIPLAFALALLWRYRDRVWPPALVLGLSVSAKPLLWPMFVWMLLTRRARASLLATAIGIGVTIAAWASIGFADIGEYPALLRRLSEIQAENSYSFVGMSAALGLPSVAGSALAVIVGLGLLGGCAYLVRQGDEPRSFACAVAATLALSPIVWLHYLVLLLVPVAILRPRFSALWLLPVVLWVSPRPGYAEGPTTFAPAVVVAILLVFLLRRPRRARSAVEASA
jgi:alpha-1,2-mannosyltransferase